MNARKHLIIVAMLIIALGVAWLLNVLKIIPGVDWVWTGGLGIAGILVIALGGINKTTFVVGPFLLISSVLSILRQTGRLRTDVEIPILFIVFGSLFLLSQLLPLRSNNDLLKK